MLKLMLTNEEEFRSVLIQVAAIEEVEVAGHGPYCYYVWDTNNKLWYVEAKSEIVQALFENGKDFAYAKWGNGWYPTK